MYHQYFEFPNEEDQILSRSHNPHLPPVPAAPYSSGGYGDGDGGRVYTGMHILPTPNAYSPYAVPYGSYGGNPYEGTSSSARPIAESNPFPGAGGYAVEPSGGKFGTVMNPLGGGYPAGGYGGNPYGVTSRSSMPIAEWNRLPGAGSSAVGPSGGNFGSVRPIAELNPSPGAGGYSVQHSGFNFGTVRPIAGDKPNPPVGFYSSGGYGGNPYEGTSSSLRPIAELNPVPGTGGYAGGGNFGTVMNPLGGGYSAGGYGGNPYGVTSRYVRPIAELNPSPGAGGYSVEHSGFNFGTVRPIAGDKPNPPVGVYSSGGYADLGFGGGILPGTPITMPKKIHFYDEDDDERSSTPKSGINMAKMVADPDGDSSSLCSACTLPIFSTPSVSITQSSGRELLLHNQCTNLPNQFLHELHPQHALLLVNHLPSEATAAAVNCSNCLRICGAIFYQCTVCEFRLDLLCVLQIKIVHRSHNHTMSVIKQREAGSLTCSSCDTKHEPSESEELLTLSYLCDLCGYWIHPDCATLINAIVHYDDHQHSLFLTYRLPTGVGSKCVICSTEPKRSSGVYICLHCSDYLVHIRCALKRAKSFKPVFIREANVADLCHLPMTDENTSLIPYIRGSGNDDDHHDEKILHSHPLIFHKTDEVEDNDDDDDEQSSRVCNACVQSISLPFFSCSQCPDFFLHNSCAHLPTEINNRVHKHPLVLFPKAPKSDISSGFTCKGCHLQCNGFSYSCKSCEDFTLDVGCAFINPAITHHTHKKTHILFMCNDIEFGTDQICNCCTSGLSGICFECSICRDFKLHMRCALLPITVRHAFDKHPLQLITTVGGTEKLCEVCEEYMETKCWYYGCSECDQSFHIECIPAVDGLSRMKLGSSVRVDRHGCAVTLTRQDGDVCGGRRCGFCTDMFKNGLAYECSKCFYGIHHECAKKCLLKLEVPLKLENMCV